jgi:hypothetical protein
MEQDQKVPVRFSSKDKSVILYDSVSDSELFIPKWTRMGRGNTSVSDPSGGARDKAYVVFLHLGRWYQATVDPAVGINVEEISEEAAEKTPLIWLDNDTNSNW